MHRADPGRSAHRRARERIAGGGRAGRRARGAAPGLVAFATAAALASCGGGGESAPSAKPSHDADRLVAQASGPNQRARSGQIDGEIEVRLTGVTDVAEPFSATISGPFRYRAGSAVPDYELDLGVRDYGAELSSVGGRSFISIGDTGYALPRRVRARLARTSARGANGLTRVLEQLGVAPWRWETDRRIVATERLDGVEVAHIRTSFNAGRILRDANTLLGLLASLGIARATGLPSRITHRARRIIVAGVTEKKGESWIGLRDHVLRRSGFTMRFHVAKADRAAVGGITGGTIAGRLHVTEVGTAQRIGAPAKVGSLADFELAIDALGDAQEARRGR